MFIAQQEDDEMVVQVVYVFYALITHEELSESLMGGSAHVGAYLIDLMHDRNAPIRAMCDRALSLIAVSAVYKSGVVPEYYLNRRYLRVLFYCQDAFILRDALALCLESSRS